MIISENNINLMIGALLEGNIINRENGRKVLEYILNRSNEGFKLSWALPVARRYIGNFNLTDPITVGEETIKVIEETSHKVNGIKYAIIKDKSIEATGTIVDGKDEAGRDIEAEYLILLTTQLENRMKKLEPERHSIITN